MFDILIDFGSFDEGERGGREIGCFQCLRRLILNSKIGFVLLCLLLFGAHKFFFFLFSPSARHSEKVALNLFRTDRPGASLKCIVRFNKRIH